MNVLLDDRERAKLTDFGLSEIKLHTSSVSQQARSGTARWGAPELVKGEVKAYTQACDVYSLGMTFVELATREVPHADVQIEFQIMGRFYQQVYPSIPEDTHAVLREVIYSAWQYDPSQRATLDTIIAHLSQSLGEIQAGEAMGQPPTAASLRPALVQSGFTSAQASVPVSAPMPNFASLVNTFARVGFFQGPPALPADTLPNDNVASDRAGAGPR